MTLKHILPPSERVPKLKDILSKKGFIRAIEVHNGLSGIIVNDLKVDKDFETLEFDALWESSLTDSASKGLPDIELVSMDSRLATTEQIARVTDKPIIFDGDTGGERNQFEYLIPRLEAIGVSAIIIEDKVFPKRNSLYEGAKQDLEDPRVFAEKIKAGKAIQRSRDFMIIARIESLIAGGTVEDALKRAGIYLKAGVDGIMIHSKDSNPEKIIEFARKYKELSNTIGFGKPLVAVPTTYNKIYDSELKDLGFNIVIHANHTLRASYKAIEEISKIILLNDRSHEANSLCIPIKNIFDIVGFSDIAESDKTHANTFPVIITTAGRSSLPEKIGQGERPKALININGKTLLENQINLLSKAGINDINVVIGYKSEMFDIPGVNYVKNDNWQQTYVIHSMMLARNKMKNGFIYMNSDTILNPELMRKLLKSDADITLIADNSYPYHKHEVDKNLDLIIAKEGETRGLREIRSDEKEVKSIGKNIPIDEATHEVLSMIKFSEEGAKNFVKVYEECIKNHNGQFHEVESIHKADFTDIFQEMISRGFKINFIETHKGWLELHNEKDYELVSNYFK